MYSVVNFGFLQLQTFNVMVFLGALSGVLFVARKFSQDKSTELSIDSAFYLGAIAVASGVIGCRVFFVLEYAQNYDWGILNYRDTDLSLAFLAIPFFLLCLINLKYLLHLSLIVIVCFYLRSFDIQVFILAFIIVFWFIGKNIDCFKNLASTSKITWLISIAALLVFIRLVHLYSHFNEYNWEMFSFSRGGMTIYGGLLLGFISCAIYIKKYRMPFLKILDIAIVSIFLAMVWGRMGCFFNGCCFGHNCSPDAYFAVHFPTASPVGQEQLRGMNIYYLWNTYVPEATNFHDFLALLPQKLPHKTKQIFFPPVYATQVISAIYNFILFITFYLLLPRKKYDGQIFLLGICAYSTCRFFVEMWRKDNLIFASTGLTLAQGISYILFCISCGLLLFFFMKVNIYGRYRKN